ncbi:hypothetical protein INT47_008323 [Mucor saturninus]|uniref:Uncharacterized protein n=1 Tax=Mucor saturninus TaxID=64648 RepID=A0A8H7V6Y5_9FUNG|nr:hypothetical protein INT47_008323 [Mucor saturninus]
MSTFESLPREIWDIILFYVGDHVKKGQWMAINKNWCNMYLPLAYISPVIHLNAKRSKFYGIVYSPFSPGQLTTSITFRFFKEDKRYTKKVTRGKLYRLMMCTPHVEEVKFSVIENVKKKSWDYFYKVLKAANTWKLRHLPDDWELEYLDDKADMALIYSTYLECAQHLRHSLNSLRLMKEMMSTNMDLSFLNVLTALRSLDITKGFLKSVYDLDLLLQHVPQLEELEVDFVDTSFISDHDNGGIILAREYPNIKTLNFHSFVLQTDQQACIFYTNFTGLQTLHIEGIQNELTLKPETAKKFFKMLSSLLNYNFGLRGNFIGKSDFISKNCLQVNHVLLSGRRLDYDESPVCVKKSKLFPDGTMQHIFPNDCVHTRRITYVLGLNIEQPELAQIKDSCIQDFLKALFNHQHRNLRSIVFDELRIMSPIKTDLVFTSYIQSISFNKCRFSKSNLQVLLACFTNLGNIHFSDCALDGYNHHYRVDIIIPKTDVHQLCISNSFTTFPKSTLISLTLADEGAKKYYYIEDEGILVAVETTEQQFLLFTEEALYNPDFTKIINIHVKSIRKLVLKLYRTNQSKDIHLVF